MCVFQGVSVWFPGVIFCTSIGAGVSAYTSFPRLLLNSPWRLNNMQLSRNKLHCVMLLLHGLAQVGGYLATFFKGAL